MAAKGITYDDILRDLKAQKVAPIYYLMGEEDYYIDKLSDAIVDAVLTEDEKDFNLDIVYGAEVDIDKVIELAHAYPMMAEKRVVLVRAPHSHDGSRLLPQTRQTRRTKGRCQSHSASGRRLREQTPFRQPARTLHLAISS